MNWDVTYDGSDYESCDSNSDFLVEENNVVSSMARLAQYGETVVPKDLAEKDGNVLKEASSAIGEKAENIKKGLLESSQNKGNVTENIWKCEKVPSENLPDKRAIFVVKKCSNGDKNDATEPAIKKCISNKKEVSNGLVDGNKCGEAPSEKKEENNIQCIWKDPSSNVFQEGKGCYPSSKVLETLTKEVLPFFWGAKE